MRRTSVTLEHQPDLATTLCGHLGLKVTARADASGDEQLFPNRITLEGPDASLLLGNKAQGLDALQFLLHEAHGERDETKLAYLDVQRSRFYRMHEVKAMAALAIGKARELGSYTFSALTARERRWIHLIVARESDVASESEGTGAVKSVKVFRKA